MRLALLIFASAFLIHSADTVKELRDKLAALESQGQRESLEAADLLVRLSDELRLGAQPSSAEVRLAAKRAVEIRERLLPGNDPGLADALVCYASALSVAGEFGEALRTQERVLAIRERAFSPQSEEVAESLLGLGAACIQAGDYPRALALEQRALTLYLKLKGEDYWATAQVLNDLGILLGRMGNWRGGKVHLARALAIRTRIFPPNDPLLAASLNNLAIAANALNQLEEARALYERALAVREKSLPPGHPRIANGMDNLATVLAGMGRYEEALELMRGALAIREKSLGPALPEIAISWNNIGTVLALSGKSAEALDAALRAEEISRNHLKATVREMPDRVAMLYSRAREGSLDLALALAARDRSDSTGSRVFEALVRSRSLAIDELMLRRRPEPNRGETTLEQITDALPSGWVLVSFARFDDPLKPAGTRYAAIVVSRGRPPVCIPLGSAPAIDSLVLAWRREVAREAAAPGLASFRHERSCRLAGLALRRKVWDPIAPHLGKPERVVLIPDGALYSLNFSALPSGAGYLADAGPVFHYLDSERDLNRQPAGRPGQGLLAVGGVHYSFSYNGVALPALPASAAEVRDIAALSTRLSPSNPPVILSASNATPSAVGAIAPGKSIVHFATHALPPGAFPQTPGAPPVLPAMKASLALAGKEREGLLTADDASRIRLGGVDLVVLSGCATAAGEASGNDGLLGLRRAFHLAGAASVIGGLWPVEDAVTREWMLAFYRAYLDRRSAAEAAALASRELLRARRARGLSTHPFSWAAFVAFGR